MRDKKNIEELSIISKHMIIKGNLTGAGDLKIDGRIEGDISIDGNIFLSESGEVTGNISANNLACNGKVTGSILVQEKLTLESKSKIMGDIKTRIIIIEEGAELNGKCIAVKSEEILNS